MLTTCVGFSVPAIAEEPAGEVAANQASVEAARKLDTEEALSSLKRMSDFLAGQERFLLKVTVRRPDRFRFDVRNRDGRSSSILFDGKRIAMDFPQLEAYAAVEKPAQIDEALDYLTGSLEIPAPLSELMRRDLYAAVGGAVTYGLVVGDATLDRKECTHVAFRTSDRDIQVWIERGDRPLPVRLVITYIADEGTPQFWAQFLTWEIGVEAPDELFTYAPPDGAERLDFLAGAAAPDTKEAR
jgi:hypothetical protein